MIVAAFMTVLFIIFFSLFIHKNKLIMIRYYDYGITDDSMVGLEDFYKIIDSIKLRGA